MNTMLLKFKAHSKRWHQSCDSHDYRGRTHVVAYLTSVYGVDAVLRHKKSIMRALDNAEGVFAADR